ncbi:MAG: peptidogalycan biosysnthesis protein [Polyangia bacterium]
MSALSVSVHGSISELQKEAWNALLTDSDNPFVRYEFLAALEQSGCVCPETSWTPCHFAIRRGNTLCAVVPAYIKDGSDGDFSRDWEWAGAAQRRAFRTIPSWC